MADVVRLNELHKDLLKEYYDLQVKRYGSDCSILPASTEFSRLILCALRDSISYNEWLLSENDT